MQACEPRPLYGQASKSSGVISRTSQQPVGFDVGVPIRRPRTVSSEQTRRHYNDAPGMDDWAERTDFADDRRVPILVSALNGRLRTVDVDVRFENRRLHRPRIGTDQRGPHVGLEFDYRETVALRLGYTVLNNHVGGGPSLSKVDIVFVATFGTAAVPCDTTHFSSHYAQADISAQQS